jgi:hypothetical protein
MKKFTVSSTAPHSGPTSPRSGMRRRPHPATARMVTGVFLTYLVPGSLLFIPLFQIVGALGLINNV